MKKTDEKLNKMDGFLEDVIDKKDGAKKTVFRAKKQTKINFENGGRYMNSNLDRSLLLKRIQATRNYSDVIVWESLTANLSILTGLSHCKQSEIAEMTGLDKSVVSHAMKRLKNTVETDDEVLDELVREFEGNKDTPPGFILNPELVIIGEHSRARKLWNEAEEQREEKAKKQAQSLIYKIKAQIENSDCEVWKVVKDELDSAKTDENVRAQVRCYFNEEF